MYFPTFTQYYTFHNSNPSLPLQLLATDRVNNTDEAVRLLHKRPVPPSDTALPTIRKLAKIVLSRAYEDEGPSYVTTLKLLRESYYRIIMQYKSTDTTTNTTNNSNKDTEAIKSDLYELLMCIHYHYIMHISHSLELYEISTKCAITLLKFPYIVPQDKLYYQAGMKCKEIKNINFAFMLLNR